MTNSFTCNTKGVHLDAGGFSPQKKKTKNNQQPNKLKTLWFDSYHLTSFSYKSVNLF